MGLFTLSFIVSSLKKRFVDGGKFWRANRFGVLETRLSLGKAVLQLSTSERDIQVQWMSIVLMHKIWNNGRTIRS